MEKLTFKTAAQIQKAQRIAAKMPAGNRIHCWHERHAGFGVRISTGSGKAVFVIMRRPAGSATFYKKTLAATSLEAATKEALPILELLRSGKRPDVDTLRKQKGTFAAVLADFKEQHLAGLRTGDEVGKAMERGLKGWLNRQLHEITASDVRDVIQGLKRKGKPYAANRLLSYTRSFFDWAIENNYADANPAAGVKAAAEERSRDRVLAPDEIRGLWVAWGKLGAFGAAMRLMLATAQRRGEVAGLKWSDIDWGKRLWTISAEDTKADRIHDVPLSPLALAIIKAQPRIGDYVFTTRDNKQIRGWSKAKGKVAGIEDWRIHDLRRTAASGMAELNVPPHVLSAILNHSPGSTQGVTAVYNRFRYLPERRHALRRWGLKLQSIVTGRKHNKALLGFNGPARTAIETPRLYAVK